MTGTPQETIRVLGKSGSPLGYMIRDFLHRSDIPYEWVELRSDEEARKEAGIAGLTATSYILPDDLNGLPRDNQRESDDAMATDPTLGTFASAVSTSFYADTQSEDTVQAIVARVRGAPSDAVLQRWRESHGADICAGGHLGALFTPF